MFHRKCVRENREKKGVFVSETERARERRRGCFWWRRESVLRWLWEGDIWDPCGLTDWNVSLCSVAHTWMPLIEPFRTMSRPRYARSFFQMMPFCQRSNVGCFSLWQVSKLRSFRVDSFRILCFEIWVMLTSFVWPLMWFGFMLVIYAEHALHLHGLWAVYKFCFEYCPIMQM